MTADPSCFDGGAVGRILQSFELSKAEELWHGKCVVPVTQPLTDLVRLTSTLTSSLNSTLTQPSNPNPHPTPQP